MKFGRREDYQSFLPDRREQRLGLGTFEGFAEKVAVPGTGQWLGNLSFPGTSTGKRERERWRIRDECIIAISFVHRAMQHNPTRAFRRIEMKVASSLPPPPPSLLRSFPPPQTRSLIPSVHFVAHHPPPNCTNRNRFFFTYEYHARYFALFKADKHSRARVRLRASLIESDPF